MKHEKQVLETEQAGNYREYTTNSVGDIYRFLSLELFSKRPDLELELDEKRKHIGIYNKSGAIDLLIVNPIRMSQYIGPNGDFAFYVTTDSKNSVVIANKQISVVV